MMLCRVRFRLTWDGGRFDLKVWADVVGGVQQLVVAHTRMLVSKEKAGKPMFVDLDSTSGPGAKSAVELNKA